MDISEQKRVLRYQISILKSGRAGLYRDEIIDMGLHHDLESDGTDGAIEPQHVGNFLRPLEEELSKLEVSDVMSEFCGVMGAYEDAKSMVRSAALVVIETMARGVLVRNEGKVSEFVMGMGYFSFSDMNGESMWQHQMAELDGYDELNDFIGPLDEELKLTGEAMKFTKDGETITDW